MDRASKVSGGASEWAGGAKHLLGLTTVMDFHSEFLNEVKG